MIIIQQLQNELLHLVVASASESKVGNNSTGDAKVNSTTINNIDIYTTTINNRRLNELANVSNNTTHHH